MDNIVAVDPPDAPAALPLNHKFSALAFDDCLGVTLPSPEMELTPNLRAYSSAPFTLPDHWQQWLGTLKSGHFAEANLVFVLTRASETPEVLDQETQDLDRELTAFVFGLMIAGVPDYSRTTWLSGANVGGKLSVREAKALDTFYRTPGQSRPALNGDALRQAASLGAEILKLFRSTQHRRVRIGFGKVVDGLKSRNPQVRLHEFMRSIDGLMGLEKGRSTKQFVARCATFASFINAKQPYQIFYDLRSAEEHLNEWKPILDPGRLLGRLDLDALALAWVDAAQEVASSVYRRLLTSPALLNEFREDATTAAFWKLSDQDRQQLWGAAHSVTVDAMPFRRALA